MKLKIGEKEYTIKFALEPTLKTRILSQLAKMQAKQDENMDFEAMEDVLSLLGDFLLVGLQKFHKDEFGFNYETGEGKEEQISKVFALIDEYCEENEEKDALMLYTDLMNEVTENGFLKNLFKQEQVKAEKQEKKAEKTEKEQEKIVKVQ